MSDDRQKRIETILDRVRELSPDERERYIEGHCSDDSSVKDAVRSLLAHHDEAQRVFVPPAHQEVSPPTPDRIGPYEIIRTLGEGGMGTVYLARQKEPIAREVALKVIKPGMDSRQVLSRFQAEQQALAQLDHPSIAKVFDAGSTDDGRPWFAMEFVSGTRITRYCDDKRMDFRDRIRIFLQVCNAIQHAHQKGIIHRDIKPGNVIVTEHDGVAVPKVIDFGIAKATETGAIPAATLTHEGQLVGTLEYMSPEQAAAQAVDTRADVYALGLLLYELLVGVLPFDTKALRDRGIDAMIRIIRDSEPARPSTRVSTLGDTAVDQARRRGTEPRSLARRLRGDLDWIVLKAIEKERERRYASAAGFAEDLSRYLESRPVEARSPSAIYRMKKFTRRHRIGVSIAALIVVALLAISVVTAWQSERVARERDRVEHEGKVSSEVATYLGDLFHGAATTHGFPDSVRLMDAMEMGVENLGTADITPEARIRVLRIFGDAYVKLTRLEEARPVVQTLVDQSVVYFGADHIETAYNRFLLMSLYQQTGESKEVLRLAASVLPVFERELGPDDAKTLRCVWYSAAAHRTLGQHEVAIVEYSRLEEAYVRTLGEDHPRLGMLYNEMTFPLLHLRHYEEAEASARRSLAILSGRYGDTSPMVLLPLDALADVLVTAGKYDEAMAELDEADRIVRETYGAAHPEAKRIQATRGWVFLETNRYDEARLAFEDALRMPGNAQERISIDPLVGLSIAQRELGNTSASRKAIERALAIQIATFGENHHGAVRVLTALGETEVTAGNLTRADSVLSAAVTLADEELKPDDPSRLMGEVALGECLTAEGEFKEAEPLLLTAQETIAATYPQDSRYTRRVRRSLADLYTSWGKPESAAKFR